MARLSINPAQQTYVAALENSVSRGDVAGQQIKAAYQLADFWKDSAKQLEPYLFYLSKAALLENSEKNLTFAAQLALDACRTDQRDSIRNWKADLAIQLFEKAIKTNPTVDSLKVGLGSCYILGKAMLATDGTAAMTGVGILREVLAKDSLNIQAQLVMGIGGFISGQYDKAIPRLQKVVKEQPNNLEAVNWLADCYGASGNNAQAIRWYEEGKRIYPNPDYIKEVDARIKELKASIR